MTPARAFLPTTLRILSALAVFAAIAVGGAVVVAPRLGVG